MQNRDRISTKKYQGSYTNFLATETSRASFNIRKSSEFFIKRFHQTLACYHSRSFDFQLHVKVFHQESGNSEMPDRYKEHILLFID
jgi:hypothetical protein